MTDDEIAAALFSGLYDDMTVEEFRDRFRRVDRVTMETLDDLPDDTLSASPPSVTFVDVPVVDGVATLPDGRTVRSTSSVVRVPVWTGVTTAVTTLDDGEDDDLD